MSDVLQRVIRLAADQVGVLPEEVTPQTHFQNDLGYDSLDVVQFVIDVEEEFGVRIPDEQADKLVTVGDVVQFLEAHAPHTENAR